MLVSRLTFFWVLALGVATGLAGCDGGGGIGVPGDGGSTDDPGSGDGSGGGTDAPDSVDDVTSGGGGLGSPQPGPVRAVVTARVRNESSLRADVTLRFIRDETVVHLAFARVLPETVTAVGSPNLAELIEVSGEDAAGRALPAKSLVSPEDFDTDTPAEYVIPADDPGEPTDPGDAEPGEITMQEPAADITVTLGSPVLTRWSDSGGTAGAVVQIWLRALEPTPADTLIPAGPAIGAALDGINDELTIVVEDVAPGLYEVVGEISDENGSARSVAPGRIRVEIDPVNEPPTLSIVAPSTLVELEDGDTLLIRWQDADPDSNATITFSLVSSDAPASSAVSFPVTPPIAEDPDATGGIDSTRVGLTGVLPGLYDLVGRIDDGQAVGTSRRERVVRMMPPPVNDPPQLALLEPAADFEVSAGGSFRVRWADADANDNARISLALDPDLTMGAFDGDEILLTAAIGEDSDGTGDEIIIGVPVGVAKGKYRVAGLITDGVAETATWAPGVVHLGVALATTDPSMSWRAPLQTVRTRLGASVDVVLESADIPTTSVVQLFLDNRPYGGTVRANVTPPNLPTNGVASLALPLLPGSLPNAAWPRRFDLQAVVAANGKTFTATAPAAILVRQEVEVVSVSMLNYVCAPGFVPTGGERDFVGIELVWYGGGFEEREAHTEVAFWLTGDGLVPADNTEDSTRRVVARAVESPHVPRVIRLDAAEVRGLPGNLGDPGGTILARGIYHAANAVQHPQFGRIVSAPHPDPANLCFSLATDD